VDVLRSVTYCSLFTLTSVHCAERTTEVNKVN
jgi:hypothetical protein